MFSSAAAEADMSSRSSTTAATPGFLHHHQNPRNQNPIMSPNSKLPDAEFVKSRDQLNGSDFYQGCSNHGGGGGGGLARYRSAPSSFLAALLDSTTDNSSSGDESEAIFSAFMNHKSNNENQMQYQMKQEPDPETRPGRFGYDSGSIVGSYSVGMESHVNANASASASASGNENGSTTPPPPLARQSSSPAGFFNGFGVMGEVVGYNNTSSHQKLTSSTNGMSNHMNYSSAASSTSRFMPSIPENLNESTTIGGRESWDASPFTSMKRNRDGDVKMFSSFGGLDNQSAEGRKNSSGLVHHLSLPKNFSSEVCETEKFLQFQQDTVPCQIRAKRGCATHPRSIAERMRRTRISERMKKLQDLFPNMDKQTNTADMLDLAVEYIKDLQKQVQTLTETQAKCVCSNDKAQ